MAKTKICYIDFEFNQITEPSVNLVCAVATDDHGNEKKFWLQDEAERQLLRDHLKNYERIIGYAAVAEARAFTALGLDPFNWDWIDLFFEYRCISNHCDEMNWGPQLIDGKVRNTVKPKTKWQKKEMLTYGIDIEEADHGAAGFKPTHSLAEATFKLLGIVRDTEHKDKMRDLIISDPKEFTEKEKEDILEYCAEDVRLLPKMYMAILERFFLQLPQRELLAIPGEMILRGRYAVHTALMENRGYPINVRKTKNFSDNVPLILHECQSQINKFFPDISPFKWKRSENKYTWDQKATREWVSKTPFAKDWDKTATGQLSLSLDAFTKYFQFQHDYPENNFGAQIVRFLKLKQSIYGFSINEDSKKRNFWDSVGTDGRSRAYLNPFGAQSSRSQPGSTGFMFLKPAWMRALVEPPEGYAMAGVDYASQEYFVSALLSGDRGMIRAYLEGDVYLAFGKAIGLIPQNGTKDTHKKERDLCKSSVLGISYNMTKYGLAIKLTQDSGEVYTEDQAQEIIDGFYKAYPTLKYTQEQNLRDYQLKGHIKLPCGFYMFGDNENKRSVGNVPVQGFGASVMRKAVDLCHRRGVAVSFTLHDALYIEYKVGDEHKVKILADCMREAFVYYFKDPEIKKYAERIRLDPFAWSSSYKKDSEFITEGLKVPCSNLYLDDRASRDYETFSKFFERDEINLL